MLTRKTNLLARWLAVLALIGTTLFQVPVTAANCHSPIRISVCTCINCSYVVICGGRLGVPPSIELGICTGTNPGFAVASCTSADTGYYSCPCTFGLCGMATVVGSCCGGARTTFPDFGIHMTCTATQPGCGSGGTTAP